MFYDPFYVILECTCTCLFFSSMKVFLANCFSLMSSIKTSDALLFTHESACKVNSHSTYIWQVFGVREKASDQACFKYNCPFCFLLQLSIGYHFFYITCNMQLSKCKEILYLIWNIFLISASSDWRLL